MRSEIAFDVLGKASAVLFADRAKMLRELIRIVMAVESEPADKYYVAIGIDPSKIPAGINVPVGPSWLRLILWLLRLGAGLPAAAIPDVVSLYSNWSIVSGGRDPLTPRIAQWFYYWLRQIDLPARNRRARSASEAFQRRTQFRGDRRNWRKNSERASSYSAIITPDLAAEYLKTLSKHPDRDRALHGLMKFRGMLAQAAPKELAELTAEYLIPKEEDDDDEYSGPFPKRSST